MDYTLGFIGCGNMGSALAKAAARALPPEQIGVTGHNLEKAQALAAECGVRIADNRTLAGQSQYVVLAVKPQKMAQVLEELRPALAERETAPVLVTIAAGMTMQTICAMAGGAYPVIRLMPNTPAAIGEGMTLCCRNELTTQEQLDAFCKAMAYSGRLEMLPEGLIDAGSTISGCGPAFACLFAEALADGGVECGLPRGTAQVLAAQMLAGTAELILQTGTHPGVLKDQVCSPGGSTIAGVHALEEKGFRSACMDAVRAAYLRTRELGKA